MIQNWKINQDGFCLFSLHLSRQFRHQHPLPALGYLYLTSSHLASCEDSCMLPVCTLVSTLCNIFKMFLNLILPLTQLTSRQLPCLSSAPIFNTFEPELSRSSLGSCFPSHSSIILYNVLPPSRYILSCQHPARAKVFST